MLLSSRSLLQFSLLVRSWLGQNNLTSDLEDPKLKKSRVAQKTTFFRTVVGFAKNLGNMDVNMDVSRPVDSFPELTGHFEVEVLCQELFLDCLHGVLHL